MLLFGVKSIQLNTYTVLCVPSFATQYIVYIFNCLHCILTPNTNIGCNVIFFQNAMAGPRSAIGRAPASQVRGPGFDTRSGNILSFLLPLFQEGQLSVTGESMCTKYWLTA